MADMLPLNTAPQTVSALSANSTPTSVALPVFITSGPASLDGFTRPITLPAIIEAIAQDGTFQVKTNAGLIEMRFAESQPEKLAGMTEMALAAQGSAGKTTLIIPAGGLPKPATLVVLKTESLGEAADKVDGPGKTALPEGVSAKENASMGNVKIVVLTPRPTKEKADAMTLLAKGEEGAQRQAPVKQEAAPLPRFLQKVLGHGESQKAEAPKAMLSDPGPHGNTPSAPRVATPTPELKVAQSYQLKIIRILPRDQEIPADVPRAGNAPQIQATIIGKNSHGQTLLECEGQKLLVQDPMEVPAGSKVIAHLKETPDRTVRFGQNTLQTDDPPLREIVEALQQVSAQGAQAFVQGRVPSPAHHLGSTLIFFLSALHNGQIDEWLGPAALHALAKDGKSHLKEALVDDLQEAMQKTAVDKTVGEWKAYPVPLAVDGGFERLTLYVHRDGGHAHETAERQTDTKTRFVITMTMSKLGPIQVDGLSQVKKLDLIVRSERPLPEALGKELRAMAGEALDAVGLTGSLTLQSGRGNWVTIEEKRESCAVML
ncbi:MAG: hypothetical protein AB7E52_01200 [Bdellovibrionales bacterium]